MALEVDEVAGLVAVAGVKEVIEAHFEQGGKRCICRDVAADTVIFLILAGDHGHGVPAGEAFDLAFQLAIAGVGNFVFDADGVDVRSIEFGGELDARAASVGGQFFKKEAAALRANIVYDLIESFQPFAGFNRVNIGRAFRNVLVHG